MRYCSLNVSSSNCFFTYFQTCWLSYAIGNYFIFLERKQCLLSTMLYFFRSFFIVYTNSHWTLNFFTILIQRTFTRVQCFELKSCRMQDFYRVPRQMIEYYRIRLVVWWVFFFVLKSIVLFSEQYRNTAAYDCKHSVLIIGVCLLIG